MVVGMTTREKNSAGLTVFWLGTAYLVWVFPNWLIYRMKPQQVNMAVILQTNF